jgi:hypothetical protein
MFWLASGVFIGATIPFINFSFHEMLDITKGSFSQNARKIADKAKVRAVEARGDEQKAAENAKRAKERVKKAAIEYTEATKKVEKASANPKDARDASSAAQEMLTVAESEGPIDLKKLMRIPGFGNTWLITNLSGVGRWICKAESLIHRVYE